MVQLSLKSQSSKGPLFNTARHKPGRLPRMTQSFSILPAGKSYFTQLLGTGLSPAEKGVSATQIHSWDNGPQLLFLLSGRQPASTKCICSAQLLRSSSLLSVHSKPQLALHVDTGNCFVLAKSNIIGFQVATSVLKVLALLLYLWGSFLSRFCYSLPHFHLTREEKTRKTKKSFRSSLCSISWSASFCNWPNQQIHIFCVGTFS